MKLYLAYKDTNTLMEGYYEGLQGVFDSEKKAWAFLSTMPNFEHAEPTKNGLGKVYHFDGEMSYHWTVRPAELNKSIYDEVETTSTVSSDE